MDLVFQIALQYGKGKLTEAGIAYAMNKLGMGQSNQNPENAISFAGMNFNPKNMLMRAGLNKVMSGGKGFSSLGSGILPIVALAGLGMYRNPLRQGAPNYNPNLQKQINFLSNRNMVGRNNSSGLMQYGPNSVLSGQNVVSAFGTNDYMRQLNNKKNYFENRMEKGKPINESKYAQTLEEISEAKGFRQNENKTKNYGPHNSGGNNNGGGNQGQRDAGPGFSGSGTTDDMGSFRRGGIASL